MTGSYSAEKAFDNDLQTRWSSAFSDPQWIYADLGAIKPINRISLNWEAAYGKSYSIQTSMNLNGTEYYYIRNAEGDIIGLFDGAGTQVVSYTYDSWGKLI